MADVLEGTKDRGLLIKPSMCITKTDVDFLADCLDETLSSIG